MKLPLDKDLLRDHGDEERVGRVWERLEPRPHIAPKVRRAPGRTWLVAAAALVVGYVGGIASSGWQKSPVMPSLRERAQVGEHMDPAGVPAPDLPAPSARPAANEPGRKNDARPQGPLSGSRRDKKSDTSAASAELMAACQAGDYDKALAVVGADLNAALAKATNEQRLCLATALELRKKDDLAIDALKRVADDDSDNSQAAIAAANLARIYEAKGDTDSQRLYQQRKEILSKGALLSEPELCQKIKVEAGSGMYKKVLERADKYDAQYPGGPCTDDVNRAREEAKQKLAAQATESDGAARPGASQ